MSNDLYADDIDYRTTEEIEDAADTSVVDARELITGFPARPGTLR